MCALPGVGRHWAYPTRKLNLLVNLEPEDCVTVVVIVCREWSGEWFTRGHKSIAFYFICPRHSPLPGYPRRQAGVMSEFPVIIGRPIGQRMTW